MGIFVGQRNGIIFGLTQTFSGSGEASCGYCGLPKKQEAQERSFSSSFN